MKGYEVITGLKPYIDDSTIVVSSNGNISREVYHILPRPQVYLRGSMGLPLPVGLGLALACPEKQIIVISGDGNFLMGLEATPTCATYKPNNLKLLILDNTRYQTTGGQPTVSKTINYETFFKSLHIPTKTIKLKTEALDHYINSWLLDKNFSVLHVKIEPGTNPNFLNIPWHPQEITKRIKKLI